MIDESGNYHCDFCDISDRLGEFYTATGNHVSCQDKETIKALQKQLQAIEKAAEKYINLHNQGYILYDSVDDLIGDVNKQKEALDELARLLPASIGDKMMGYSGPDR